MCIYYEVFVDLVRREDDEAFDRDPDLLGAAVSPTTEDRAGARVPRAFSRFNLRCQEMR